MPLYEYRCADCGHQFEALVPAGRADDETCGLRGPGRRLLGLVAAPVRGRRRRGHARHGSRGWLLRRGLRELLRCRPSWRWSPPRPPAAPLPPPREPHPRSCSCRATPTPT